MVKNSEIKELKVPVAALDDKELINELSHNNAGSKEDSMSKLKKMIFLQAAGIKFRWGQDLMDVYIKFVEAANRPTFGDDLDVIMVSALRTNRDYFATGFWLADTTVTFWQWFWFKVLWFLGAFKIETTEETVLVDESVNFSKEDMFKAASSMLGVDEDVDDDEDGDDPFSPPDCANCEARDTCDLRHLFEQTEEPEPQAEAQS